MKPLPPPINTIMVPEYFSPSQLASGDTCLLRAVVGSSHGDVPSLSSHPAAEIGRVFHRLLELAARGQIPRSGSTEADVGRCLDELLANARWRLARDPETEAYADLSRTVAPLVWFQKTSMVVGIAARLIAASSPRHSGEGSTGFSAPTFEALPANGEWAEVPIKAPGLRLAGRVDLVEKRPGVVILRDLKSGRVEDPEGQILPHIDLQLRLYGVMVREVEPNRSVRLLVDTGAEHEVPFDPVIAEATV